jgi:hypothetical protein
MPTFTETHELQSLEIFPSVKTISVKWKDTSFKDGVKLQESISRKNYSNADIADFEIAVATTGGTLASIVAGFSEAALLQRDEAVTALATAQAKVTELQAKIDAYTPPVSTTPAVSITMRQARLALLSAGLLDQVNAGMQAMPQAAQIEWQFASEVRRDNALIAAMASALGLDDAAVDSLFVSGSAL